MRYTMASVRSTRRLTADEPTLYLRDHHTNLVSDPSSEGADMADPLRSQVTADLLQERGKLAEEYARLHHTAAKAVSVFYQGIYAGTDTALQDAISDLEDVLLGRNDA